MSVALEIVLLSISHGAIRILIAADCEAALLPWSTNNLNVTSIMTDAWFENAIEIDGVDGAGCRREKTMTLKVYLRDDITVDEASEHITQPTEDCADPGRPSTIPLGLTTRRHDRDSQPPTQDRETSPQGPNSTCHTS